MFLVVCPFRQLFGVCHLGRVAVFVELSAPLHPNVSTADAFDQQTLPGFHLIEMLLGQQLVLVQWWWWWLAQLGEWI